MPYQSKLLAGGTAVFHIGSGVVDGSEILAAARTVQQLARARTLLHILVDFTAATLLNATSEQIRKIAAVNLVTARLSPGGRVAIAAPQDHVFGLVRMWSVFVEGVDWQIQISRDLETSRAWLGISLDEAGAQPLASAAGPEA